MKEKTISFKTTDEFYKTIKIIAEDKGLSVSSYIVTTLLPILREESDVIAERLTPKN